MLKKEITGIILCGGKSSRMKQNKALLKLNNQFIISYVISSLNAHCNDFILSTNTKELDFLNIKIAEDKHKNIGPIAGILSALETSNTELNIIASCDTPFISTDLFNYLLSFSDNYEIVLPEINGFLQPMTGVFKKSIIKTINEEISNGNNVPPRIFKKTNLKIVKIDNSLKFYNKSLFFNINTKDDYEKAKQIMNKRIHKQ